MYSDELKNAIAIVKEAGRILLKYYDQDYEIEFKKGDGPVTAADKAANEFITKSLAEIYPEDGILSEESKDSAVRLQKSRVWVIDPMDGTREFIDKVGQFAAMIGLVENRKPVLGVVYQPTTDSLLTGVEGQGAQLIRDGQNSRLHVREVSEISQMRLVVSRSHRSPLVDSIKETLAIEEDVSSGSVGLKVGLLGEQKADLYIHPNSKTKEWDTCAPQIILEEAGGRITDCWGEPLKYNKENVYNDKGFVASNGRKHVQIIEKIQPFLEQMD